MKLAVFPSPGFLVCSDGVGRSMGALHEQGQSSFFSSFLLIFLTLESEATLQRCTSEVVQ